MTLEESLRTMIREEVRAAFREELHPELLTPGQAGDLVGRSSKTICAWMREGKLQRHGEGKPLVSRAELLSLCGPSPKRARPAGKAPSAEAEVHRLMRRHG